VVGLRFEGGFSGGFGDCAWRSGATGAINPPESADSQSKETKSVSEATCEPSERASFRFRRCAYAGGTESIHNHASPADLRCRRRTRFRVELLFSPCLKCFPMTLKRLAVSLLGQGRIFRVEHFWIYPKRSDHSAASGKSSGRPRPDRTRKRRHCCSRS